jgi:hypothetical protein
MRTIALAMILATAILTAGSLADRAEATTLGAPAANARLAAEAFDPVTEVGWWGHPRFHRHHHHHRVFFFHRFHRFHRCHWC